MAEDDLGSIVEYSEDLADQEQPELLPANDYEGEIRLAIQKISNTSGKKYAAVTFHIPVQQYPADYGVSNNPDGLNVVFRLVPLEDNPRARFQAKRFVMAIGAKPGKRIDLNDWIGQTARVTIGDDTFEGVDRETITKVQSL